MREACSGHARRNGSQANAFQLSGDEAFYDAVFRGCAVKRGYGAAAL